MTVDYNSSISP